MNYNHNKNGRFGKKSKMKWLLLPLGAYLIYGAYSVFTERIEPNPVVYVAEHAVHIAEAKREDRLDVALAKMKKEVVDRLAEKEGRGLNIEPGQMKPTFDPPASLATACRRVGGTMPSECLSYGVFQMKIPTIQLWQKQLGDKVMTDMEAMQMAFDTEKAAEFVERVIFLLPGSIWLWSGATSDRAWFDTHIGIIRELEQI